MYSRLLQDKVQVGSPLSQGLNFSGRVKLGRNIMSFTKSIGLDSGWSAYVLRFRRRNSPACLAGVQYIMGLELRMISRPAGVERRAQRRRQAVQPNAQPLSVHYLQSHIFARWRNVTLTTVPPNEHPFSTSHASFPIPSRLGSSREKRFCGHEEYTREYRQSEQDESR
jgi:hypothetical protein